MDSIASFTMATGGYYVTMLLASHDLFAHGERCYGIHLYPSMLGNSST